MDTLEKKTKVKELWQLCFHDDERFVNLLFDNLYRDENTVCFEKGGEVTTALQMLPYRMSFGETSLDVSYISGAATRPEYRNRGLMGRLLKESFEIMRSRNIPLSALIPAESWLYDYYASKGYASVFFRQELNFSSAHRFYGDGYHRVAMSMDELYRFFDEQMRRRSCCIQHGREDFNVICGDIYLDGGDVVALADSQNRLSALVFVVPGDDAVFVKELLADLGFQLRPREENEALNGELMDSLCQFRRDIREVCLKGLKEGSSKELSSSKEVNTNVSKEVLKKCDEVRQLVSDKHHCSIIDGKGDTLWVKGELPKKETKKEAKKQSNQLTPDCPPSEMFKRTGEFSQFDAAGFPLLDKNGKPLSPTKQKKLRKRYETHKAIHEKWLLQHKAYSVCQQTRQLYSFVSSSDTEYGLNTPRSVIKKVMYSGGR